MLCGLVQPLAAQDPSSLLGAALDWTLADGYRVRVTFGAETVIPPGGVLVVFGGGDPSGFNLPGSPLVVIAPEGLGLTNTGDSVYLSDPEGNLVDGMTYGEEGGNDRSLTRAVDGDGEASFIPHPGTAAFSPGTRSDGTSF